MSSGSRESGEHETYRHAPLERVCPTSHELALSYYRFSGGLWGDLHVRQASRRRDKPSDQTHNIGRYF